MTAQNRYYSNTAQATTLNNPAGINATETDIQVAANVGFPSSFPFVLRIEYGTTNEEAVLVTSGAGTPGTPYQATRGYDGTTARAHATGVPVAHGFVQADFQDPQLHLNLSGSASNAHGLPASAWTGGTLQLIASASPVANQASITFSNIPQTFNHLWGAYQLGSSGTPANSENLVFQINGDTNSHYGNEFMSILPNNTGSFSNGFGQTAGVLGLIYNSGTPNYGNGFFVFPNYAASTYKAVVTSFIALDPGTTAGSVAGMGGSSYNVSTAITSLKVFPGTSPGFKGGGLISLYGVS